MNLNTFSLARDTFTSEIAEIKFFCKIMHVLVVVCKKMHLHLKMHLSLWETFSSFTEK